MAERRRRTASLGPRVPPETLLAAVRRSDNRVEVRLQDYREPAGERLDAMASIEMGALATRRSDGR